MDFQTARRRCLLSVGLLFLCSVPQLNAQDAPEPQAVFLLIGQSNMAGRAPLEAGDDAPIDGAWLLDDKGAWLPAASPLNRFATDRKVISMQRIGPGDGFVRRLRELKPDLKIGLVVNARGGTKIEEWGADQKLYVNALARLKQHPDLKLAGVLWHQGEGNSNDPKYLTKLQDLVSRLRADLKDPELPFVAGEVYGDRPVNRLIGQLPASTRRTGVASAAELKVFDGVHFDRDSQLRLGARYADAWVSIVDPPAKD